jgi:hypothetical protein
VGLVATGIVLVGQLVVCLSQGEEMNMAGTVSFFFSLQEVGAEPLFSC